MLADPCCGAVLGPRHLLSLADLTRDQCLALLDHAAALKAGDPAQPVLAGRSVALLFEKSSTRTRVSFEVGIHQLGGHSIFLPGRDSQMGRGEPIRDTARVLSRMVSAIVIRTHAHADVVELARWSQVPVINALTDRFHPCQVLADLLTIREVFGSLDRTVAWLGDGNNMAHSWIEAAALLGVRLRLASPPGYRAAADLIAAAPTGLIEECPDPVTAVTGADVVVTDVWASMGQEGEQAARARAFAGYQLDDALLAHAAPDAIVLHCLPAHRGEEISDAVLEGPHSRVWDEAENRLHVQKALLTMLLA